MNVEVQGWTLIGVVIAGGGLALSVLLRAIGSLGDRIDSHDLRFDSMDRRFDSMDNKFDSKIDALDSKVDGKIDALSNRMDVKFDLMSSRIDALVAEVGHVNVVLGELAGKAHTHDRVA
jgi:hypothetical protein